MRKYLAITTSSQIIDNIKDIADGYWTVGGNVILFYYEPTKDESTDVGKIRDKIKGSINGSLALIDIITRGNAAAVGMYANQKTWDWIKNFCTDDTQKVADAAVKDYKDKETIFSLDGDDKTYELEKTDGNVMI